MTVGIDVTSVERMRALLLRYPDGEERFFTRAERRHCNGFPDPMIHFAGTFAAKEAVVKAARLGSVAAWASRIEILRDPSGAPRASIRALPQREVTVSISHDGDVAVAIAICAPVGGGPSTPGERLEDGGPLPSLPVGWMDHVPNPNLRRFLAAGYASGGRPGNGRGASKRLTDLAECSPGSDFP